MALLRLANDETKKIPLDESGESWIIVKADISKRQFIDLLRSTPQNVNSENLTIDQGIAFQEALFKTFIVDWSLDKPATVDVYMDLNREASEAIDQAIADHFTSLTPTKDEATKS